MDRSSLTDSILYWSSSLTAEQKMLHYTACIDPLLSDFYWTYEFRKFAEGLLGGSSNLVFLVGLQGGGEDEQPPGARGLHDGQGQRLLLEVG
jgi:hypothetical protein